MRRFDPKAVLEGRVPGRPRVGLILGIAVLSLAVLVSLLFDAAQSLLERQSAAPFAIALVLALVPVPLLIAGVLFLDRLEPEPASTMVIAFLWGAGVAVVLAGLLNTLGLVYVTQPRLGTEGGLYVSATFGAPVIEETLKGVVLLGLLRFRRQELDGPTDGIIYASLVALGFAAMENVGYYTKALLTPDIGGGTLLAWTFVMRGLFAPLAHPLFTSMIGLGVAYAALRPRGGWAIGVGWLAAMFLHGMWNALSGIFPTGLVTVYVLLFWVLVGLIVVVVVDRRRVSRLIARYLPGYGVTGLVTPQDVRMLSSLRERRSARHWARLTGGLGAAAAMSDYQLAATELALAHNRAERGVLGPTAFRARQASLLRLMEAARAAFLRRHPEQAAAPWAQTGPSGFVQPYPLPARLPPPTPNYGKDFWGY